MARLYRKYGIPPMFVVTDREDRKRFEELYENMLNFKSNHFGVLRGNETVQFGTAAQSSNSNVFKDLAKLANDEVSKRINGATGSTDEKAHVGAAQVHAEILKAKIKLDKFFIEVLINEELIPRLIKLSPVYSGLDNYTFEWDEAETLNLDELIDAVISLSSFYEIDVEYLSKKTGIPINGLKQLGSTPPTPEDKKDKKGEKKKPKVNPVQSFYQGIIDALQVEAIDLSNYTKLIERIAKGLHNGTIKPEALNAGLINQTYNDLASSTAHGWGKDWVKFGNDIGQDKTVLSIQKNIFRFSGAKTYAQLKEFNELLYKDGQLRTYNEFKDDVLKVNKRYNKNYLQAEHQTARQAGHHGRNWHQYQKDKDLFPNLEYRTVADERVREEHSTLHKIVKAIDDPFWDTYYPPNGWRCRCYVVQTTGNPTKGNTNNHSIKPEFRVNVGKTGTVYSEKHPFFAIASSSGKEVQNAFELSKLHAPYTKVYKAKKGATVQVSPFADQQDFKDNFNIAKKMADSNISVKIRPHIILEGYKNPEYEIDKKMGDLKTQKGKNVSSNLKSAKRQGARVVVFDVQDSYPYNLIDFKNTLRGQIKAHYKDAFDTFIIIKGNDVERIEVKELIK